MNRIFSLISLFILIPLTVEAQSVDDAAANQNPYTFGGACASQGPWTQAALRATQEITAVIEKLRDNPDCKAMTDALTNLTIKQVELENSFTPDSGASPSEQESMKSSEGLTGQMSALQTAMTSDPSLKKEAGSLLLQKLMSMVYIKSKADLVKRVQKASYAGISIFNQLATAIPNSEKCLAEKPDNGVVVLGGLMNLAGSLTSVNGEGLMGEFGKSLGILLNAMRSTKYNQVIRKLYQSQYWSSISCLIETTAENYCSVKDANSMRNFMTLETDVRKRSEQDGSKSPLRGYFILEREVGIVSAWLQQVQFGVEPRTTDQAIAKNNVLQNSTNFYQTRNTLLATYNQAMISIKSYQSITAKKNAVFTMLRLLVDGVTGVGSSGAGENFFILTKNQTFIPFYLIGMNQLPDEVKKLISSTTFDWSYWMSTQGAPQSDGTSYIAEFNNPDTLAEIIYIRLVSLMNEAELNASAYYRNMFIVDVETLINETVVSQTINVYQSLKNIYKYLDDISKWISSSGNVLTAEDKLIGPSIKETKMRIKLVLDSYDSLMELGAKYYSAPEDQVFDHIRQDFEWAKKDGNGIPPKVTTMFGSLSFQKSYSQIMQTALDAFNIIMQKDTFLFTRLSPIVRYDFTKKIQKITGDSYQNDLLIINGKNLLDRMRGAAGNNTAAVKLDLSQAQWINRQNLAALEEMFATTVLPFAMQTKLVSEDRLTVQVVRDEQVKMNKFNGCLNLTLNQKDSLIFEGKTFRNCMDFMSQNDLVRFFATMGASVSISNSYGVVKNDPMIGVLNYGYYEGLSNQKYRTAIDELIKTGQTGIGYASSTDDPYHSAATLWGKTCLQSLVFNNAQDFFYVCANSYLQGHSQYISEDDSWRAFQSENRWRNVSRDFTAYAGFHEKNKSASYNALMKRYLYEADSEKKKEWRDQNICALRSYMRRSYVYSLTVDLQSSSF